MAVAGVAAAIDHIGISIGRQLELPGLILVQRPQVILAVEKGVISRRLIRFESCVADFQQMPVFLGRHAGVLFLAGGTVPGEGVHVGSCFDHFIDDAGHLIMCCEGEIKSFRF